MYIHICWGFPGDSAIKKFPVNEGDARSIPGLRRSPREKKKWQLTPVFLPGKPHGQKSLVGYTP